VTLRSRLAGVWANPMVWVRVHATLTILWMLLIFPSVLLWRDSVAWLVIMSVWANVAGSVASLQAARADRNSPTVEDVVRLEQKIDALRGRINLLARGR
jgi:hypothetical protein